MKNQEVAKIFYDMALLFEAEGVSFKPQAYERAALALKAMSEDVAYIYKKDGTKGLNRIPGIGKGMTEKIEEYLKSGRIKEYMAMQKKLPMNMAEITSVEGVGPKMAKELYSMLNIKSLKDLEKAAKKGAIRKLPRFGEKTEQNILQGIEFVKRSEGRWLISDILPYAESLLGKLKKSGLVKEAVIAGSLRRMKETIGDVDILITTKVPKKAFDYFLTEVSKEKIWGRGTTKVSIHVREGFDVDVRALSQETFGAGLQYLTGSKEHNVNFRTLAKKKGYKISE